MEQSERIVIIITYNDKEKEKDRNNVRILKNGLVGLPDAAILHSKGEMSEYDPK